MADTATTAVETASPPPAAKSGVMEQEKFNPKITAALAALVELRPHFFVGLKVPRDRVLEVLGPRFPDIPGHENEKREILQLINDRLQHILPASPATDLYVQIAIEAKAEPLPLITEQLETAMFATMDVGTSLLRSLALRPHEALPLLDDMNISSGLIVVGQLVLPAFDPSDDTNKPYLYHLRSGLYYERRNDVALTGDDEADLPFAYPSPIWEVAATSRYSGLLRQHTIQEQRREFETFGVDGELLYAASAFGRQSSTNNDAVAATANIPLLQQQQQAQQLQQQQLLQQQQVQQQELQRQELQRQQQLQPSQLQQQERRSDEFHERRGPARTVYYWPGYTYIDGRLVMPFEGRLVQSPPLEASPGGNEYPVSPFLGVPVPGSRPDPNNAALLGRMTAAAENELMEPVSVSGFPSTPQRPEAGETAASLESVQLPAGVNQTPASPFAPPVTAIATAAAQTQAPQPDPTLSPLASTSPFLMTHAAHAATLVENAQLHAALKSEKVREHREDIAQTQLAALGEKAPQPHHKFEELTLNE